MSVVIETTKGVFTVDLYIDQRPKVCKNFLKLCKVKFYNLSLFHSVQTNFIAQTGDPTEKGTSGGESIYRRLYGDQARYFEGDIHPKLKHNSMGTISMVSAGDNMFGSQFFITLADNLESLDAGQHCVFGKIVEGNGILEILNETICDNINRPYQEIRITHTVILEDPFPDPSGLEIPSRSPEPSLEIKTSGIAADEDLEENDGLTEREIAEQMARKEAEAQATILEMVGDLPEAECAPPENVLFVCKLNPVTTDDDLEIIFSRFGRVVSCEVIRDRKTGDSLQYSFVEFEDKDACEKAYFKMDNVLIDDRRIHVDFSQSVSKFTWKGKGRLEINEDHKKQKHPAQFKKTHELSEWPIDKRFNARSKNHTVEDRHSNNGRAYSHRKSHSPSRNHSKRRSRSRSRHRDNSPHTRKHQKKRRSRSNERHSYHKQDYHKKTANDEKYPHFNNRAKNHDEYELKDNSERYSSHRHSKEKKKRSYRSRSRS